MLEVLADPEEITGQSVVEQEVIDLLLDRSGACLGVVLQAAAVAHFGIALLASGKRLTKVCHPHATADAVTRAANSVELKVHRPQSV